VILNQAVALTNTRAWVSTRVRKADGIIIFISTLQIRKRRQVKYLPVFAQWMNGGVRVGI
jgi:hypothetical protein